MKKQNQKSLRAALDMAKEGSDTGAYSHSTLETAALQPSPVATVAKKPKADVRFGVYVPPSAMKALYDLAHEESGVKRKKVNDYFLEGIDRVFAERGLPSIAQLTEQDEKEKA